MIIDVLTEAGRYECLHPLFEKVFEFLKQRQVAELPDGKHELQGDHLFVIVLRNGDSKSDYKLEAHLRYVDIHVVIKGEDTLGWKPLSSCVSPIGIYQEKEDHILFADTDFIKFSLSEGMFAVFFPEDAHVPLLETKQLHKLVFKVKL